MKIENKLKELENAYQAAFLETDDAWDAYEATLDDDNVSGAAYAAWITADAIACDAWNAWNTYISEKDILTKED